MNILPPDENFFDKIFDFVEVLTLEQLKKTLEERDRVIYSMIDRKRFKLIRIDERTQLTRLGIFNFKRRYYRDMQTLEYVYLLDNELRINKYQRVSNDLKKRVVKMACDMPYSKIAKHLDYLITKTTIHSIIKDSTIEVKDNTYIEENDMTIHVQIDEVFVGKKGHSNKKRYYTCTIFKGIKEHKHGNKLINRRIMSSNSLKTLERIINFHLKQIYKVTINQKIYLSGDMANYIQRFPERIMVCRSTYVPDKYHVLRDIRNYAKRELGEILVSQEECISFLLNLPPDKYPDEIMKLLRLYKRDPLCFKKWDKDDYLGCSQEGMNSHYYVQRIKKYVSRFNEKTIEKICRIREAIENGSNFEIKSKKYPPREYIDYGTTYYLEEEIYKMTLDTRDMSYQTRKMFDNIKYGNIELF